MMTDPSAALPLDADAFRPGAAFDVLAAARQSLNAAPTAEAALEALSSEIDADAGEASLADLLDRLTEELSLDVAASTPIADADIAILQSLLALAEAQSDAKSEAKSEAKTSAATDADIAVTLEDSAAAPLYAAGNDRWADEPSAPQSGPQGAAKAAFEAAFGRQDVDRDEDEDAAAPGARAADGDAEATTAGPTHYAPHGVADDDAIDAAIDVDGGEQILSSLSAGRLAILFDRGRSEALLAQAARSDCAPEDVIVTGLDWYLEALAQQS